MYLYSITGESDNHQKNPPTTVLINELLTNAWTPFLINRTGWIVTANSEQTTKEGREGPIANIIDGTSPYLWHSKYNDNEEGGHDDREEKNDPFQFTINLGKKVTFRAFSYMPRPGLLCCR